jgi:Ran GTPase-activating protein (RanGAP) involved in mRNA processing and transport
VEGFANKGLKVFDISNNALCPDGCLIIGKLFQTNPGIKYLWLNHVAFSRDGTEYISKAITDAKLDLKSLQVNKNRMGEKGHFFGKMLNSQKNLKELILFQNDLRNNCMKENSGALINMQQLEVLDISDNFFDEESFKVFCESLIYLKSLKVLNMSDCNIDPDMTKAFIPVLQKFAAFSELEKFSYNYNEVEEEDMEDFFDCLAQFKNLKKIECKVELDEDQFDNVRGKFEDLDDENCVLESEDDMDASLKSDTEEEKKLKEEKQFSDLMNKLESLKL